uniref:Usher syndrome 2A (autosomal recessive, mild) n=1 Tax=Kryptolebias marmoratus TaxID=37003 RepID=A0A3Q3B8L8_KRYMA
MLGFGLTTSLFASLPLPLPLSPPFSRLGNPTYHVKALVALPRFPHLSQGHFPRMENIAAFKPVFTSPPRSTCGVPERSSYCQSPSSQAELLTCFQAVCVQECPYRSSTPPNAPLLLAFYDAAIVVGAHYISLDIYGLQKSVAPTVFFFFCCCCFFQIYDRHVSLFLDGLEEDGTPFDTKHLTDPLSDISESGAMWVGLGSNGEDSVAFTFVVYCFNREIVEVYSGVLPELHVQSECRCPPSHPRVHPLVERYCIPNAVEDTTNDRVLRLNLNAHPLSYINDQDMGTTWKSKTMTAQELDEGVTITVDLANGQYQVFYVIVQFGGLLPESVLIQRRRLVFSEPESTMNIEQSWLDWQYMARNCNVFDMQNNGPLPRPDSVNCLQLPSDVPFSGGNITFSLLTTHPVLRPGYNDFYKTPALQEMVQAAQVRLHMRGQYHTKGNRVNQQHRYFAIKEITISGRCECNGHADHCDTSVTPCRCLCLPESHTVGNNCQHCAPLYNDKPFRSGDQLQPMNCRPCQCHGHASSCHYDIMADDQPDEHYRGGGGVCDHCMHNTTGKNCEQCTSGFFRLEDFDPTLADVCRPCNCNTAGTVNGNTMCTQVGGQCQCKATVTGRQCADCLPGWFGLSASNPNGCMPCNCSGLGVIQTSTRAVSSCNQRTGQCHCKPHVTGLSCDRCEFGYWNLSHPDGCIPCDCDPLGSFSSFCEPEGGQCECKPGVGGQRCDSCGSGLYGLGLEGSCAPCNCSHDGTVLGTDCDPYTGQCVCKEHVEGRRCDSCRRGYHTLERRNSLGCLPCVCDISGTVPGGVCDMWTGQCPCKEGVEGVHCTSCLHNYYNRSLDPESCVPCICDPRGTVMGSVCDSTTGQCICVPTRHGKDCSSCRPGFFVSPDHRTCLECDCHPMGALQRSCESQTGQCVCAHSSVGGQRCDQCHEMFFGFNPGLGNRCQPCACDPVGSSSGLCHPDTGQCVCKLLVTGVKCDSCQPGASHFDLENHFGCSKAPSQQPAPLGSALSFSSIYLSWNPPDSPNSHRLNYTLIRDGQSVYTIHSYYPFGIPPLSFLTAAAPPQNQPPPQITATGPNILHASWEPPKQPNGTTINTHSHTHTHTHTCISYYRKRSSQNCTLIWAIRNTQSLFVSQIQNNQIIQQTIVYDIINHTVLQRVAASSQPAYIVKGLKPYHMFNFTLTLCTRMGCISSLPSTGRTLPAAPTGLSSPRLDPINESTIQIDWDPPAQLNGPNPLYQVGLSFKTWSPDGLLLCAFSPGDQEEFLAIQIKNGRPYFLFDPQVLSAVAVGVQGDGGRRYNDGQWHKITATRRGAVGTIVINNQYSGNYSHIHTDHSVCVAPICVFSVSSASPGDALLVRQGFSGCLRDVSLKMTDSPSEEWQNLDWTKATKAVAVYESWEGCPLHTVNGAHFLGHGYLELATGVFSGGQDFDVSLDFRTDQLNALLLFTYNTKTEDYMLVELEAGLLSFILATEGHVAELSMWVGLSYCDGDWKQLSLAKRSSLISAAMNDWAEETRGAGGAVRLSVDSPLYLGGVPAKLLHPALDGQSHNSSVSERVDFAVASRHSVRVYLDGCPTSESQFNCRGNDSVLVYSGTETQATDYSLQPFTEYLYRIIALAAGGWAASPWQRGRSRGKAPASVPPPVSVQSINGFSIKVSWVPPTGEIRGLIDRYELKAYNRDNPDTPPIKATYLANGNFTGKTDAYISEIATVRQMANSSETRYAQKERQQSCNSTRSKNKVDRGYLETSMNLKLPSVNSRFCYGCTALLYTLTFSVCVCGAGLDVYSTHFLALSACTLVGCTNSSQVTALTSQLPPGPLRAPTLTLLDSRTIFVEWSRPSQINGVLEFYSIFLSHDGAEPVLAYNNSELFEDHTLRNLTPGTSYTVRVACTGGGCTLSPLSQVQTEESTPENIPAPLVIPLSPHALNVSWTSPDTPNGVITSYGLWLDGVLILNSSSSQRFFVVERLSPWSEHVIRLQACTARGCGKGPMVEMRTLEMAPEGPMLLELTNQSSRSVRARWTAPPRANGNVSYTLYYRSKGDTCTRRPLRIVCCLVIFFVMFFIFHPMVCLLSLSYFIAPDGLSPPTLAHSTNTSVNVSWSTPINSNAPGPLQYSLQMRTSPQRPVIRLLENATDTFSYYVEGLSPYTYYLFRVVVSHAHGQTTSPWATLRTAEDRPGPVDTPTLRGLHSRTVSINWAPPSQTNGIITNYTLYLHPGFTISSNYKSSSVFSNIQVEACTSVGCSVSGMSQPFQTLAAPPEGVPAPHLYSDTPTSVLLSWGAPEQSNGPLERCEAVTFTSRRVAGTKQVSTVGHLMPDPPPLSFLDSSSALSPWTTYQYRLVLQNQAGKASGKGPWVSVTTRPSRPAGLRPPRVKVLGPKSLQVTWSLPLIPNGEIYGYEIRLPEPRFSHDTSSTSELNVTITDLVPYTNYSVTVLACSKGGGHVGGCTESLPTPAATLPTRPEGLGPLSVVAVSESFLAISWQPPSQPNGPNIRYKLLRRKTHQPLAVTMVPAATATSSPPSEDLHRWLHVYSGTKLFYQDKGLSRFTRYQYQLVVSNDVGDTSGEIVTAVTMAGVPVNPPSLTAYAVNHTAIHVNWKQPSLQDLQGEVETFFLTVESPQSSQMSAYRPEITSAVISDLWPTTTYRVSLQVFNGVHNTTKTTVNITTADGEPEGMLAPEVVPVNSSMARVLWSPPLQPNGAVTRYNIYVNHRFHGSVDNTSGSYLLRDLLPFTVYTIQVEVCTVYACTQSDVTKTTTVEDIPAEFAMPHAQVVSPRLNWSHPGKPSGIMLGYEVLRRTLRACPDGSRGVKPSSGKNSESAGFIYLIFVCYIYTNQICCSGWLYTRKPHHHCCDGSYLTLNNTANPACCSGKLVPPLPDHQCCGGYYVPIRNNGYCCPDHLQGRVSVGPGDSCCGGVPYSMTGGQLCCSGSLHDGYGVQCCGGRIVDDILVCCGDAEKGEVHQYKPGFVCCGQEYINSSTSLCCVDNEGFSTIHPAGNATVMLQCCGSKVIHQEEECCNGIGFDPQQYVCADQPTPGLSIQVCFYGAVCPLAAAATAYCGSCDLDPSLAACTWVLTAHKHPDTQSTTHTLFIRTSQETLTTGLPTHTNRNSDLKPFTSYEYRVRGWNSFGRGSSDVTTVTTNEDKPWGVAPPLWSRLGERDDVIQLQWQAPARPNGLITHYVILRDGQERYRGDEKSFIDVGGIRPFQEYIYQLRACNRAGCTDSTKVIAVTVQGVPEGVQPPQVTAVSPFSLHVSWSEPSHQNGVIQWYHLNQIGVGTIFTHTDGPKNYTVTGLQPYTDYSFVLVACTTVGCGASKPATGRTLQASPTGVWSSPRHLIINTSAVELYWDQPSQPNGLIFQYRLIRDGLTVFTGDHRDLNYTDTGLLPQHRYMYELEASTAGGTGVSDKYSIETPASCPTGIPPPHNMTVSGPYSISLAWSPPGEYRSTIMHHAGQDLQLSVTGLEPFTSYYIRVQACQNEGCGLGKGVYVRTLETTPEGLQPPEVNAVGPNILEIYWSPPKKPNGLITSYHVFRRPLGTEEELLVFIWSSGPLEFVDASPDLRPFSYFQYKIRAFNSKGSVLSQWTLAQTLQAKPQKMAPPVVTPSGAYSVHLKWTEPGQPNGLISHYRLVYIKHQEDPTLNTSTVTALTVEGSVLEATVYGLEPYSQMGYEFGSVSSPWMDIRTLEASPAGLPNFTVEQREQGRALLLSWDPPHASNGVITVQAIDGNLEFSGLARSFLFHRLEPWTVYSLTLEACTSAGCTRSSPQHIATAAAPPASQLPPRFLFIGPDHVSLTWSPPSQPNGPVGEYSLHGRSLEEKGRLRSNEEDVLFRNTFPEQTESYSYTVTGLRPWTQYEFSVCTHNPAGETCSPWETVTTRQAPPRGLAPPTLTHIRGRPSEVLVTWAPPLELNGVLQSYRIQRNNISFSFSFDPTVLTYTDEDLQPFSTYSYSVIACTSEGCIISPQTNITTLEAPPGTVEAPTVNTITAKSINISWSQPLMQNGEATEYVLKLNNKEAYRGRDQSIVLSDLQPHASYQLVLLACTQGGCTASVTVTVETQEAPPADLDPPALKVTGPESVEISWRPPKHPNGIITGYELSRDGELIYFGTETHYHDFTLLPSMEYSYVVIANNSRGAVNSKVATAKTHPSAPSGVGPPSLKPLEAGQVDLEWQIPARPNGDIVGYTVYLRDPVQLSITSTALTPEDRQTTLHGLAPYHRYEVRVEACTSLGCSSSDWSSILTLEAPPAGQPAPLLDLQTDGQTGLQTSFFLTWSAPVQPNGRILHYEVHRKLELKTEAATVVYRNVSTSYKDDRLHPFTVYRYQVWAVNSAGYSASPWVSGRTGPAPPEGLDLPVILRVSATSAVVEIHPPAQPNGIVSLYRVFSLDLNNHTLSEGTSLQQTLHGLRPYTQYWVGVEACTCFQCCSQGPLRQLHTLAAPPADQPPPRLVTLTSRSVQLEWDEPLAPNGVIERAACFNNMGSTASSWTTVSTLSEAPQYVSPFSVDSNLTIIWLDWTGTFSINGYLKEFTVTESQLRVYNGFYSYLHLPRYTNDKQGVSMSAGPVYSELWFILLFALLGLFLLSILMGLVLKRYFNGLTDTKIVGSSSHFSPMSVLRAPSPTELSQAYSQHSLHRSVSRLIDRKSLMMEEGCWDNPLGHDSGLYVEEDEFMDAIKAIGSVKKDHTMFTDTHL